MKQIFLLAVLLPSLVSCGQAPQQSVVYPTHVGDISFNEKTDDPEFKPCNSERVFQYYNFGKGFQYKGEKIAINEYFRSEFSALKKYNDTGFLTIRFIVNCEGKTGWFRIQQMGDDYKEKKFNKNLVEEILELTKKMDGWIPAEYESTKMDYYQYLTFKFQNGKLIEIMP
jgi:hypothetical protein